MNIGAILTKFTKLLKLNIISRKAILNPHQYRRETKFLNKFLHALLFSKSGQFASAMLRTTRGKGSRSARQSGGCRS